MSFKESCKWIDSRQEDLLNNLMRLSEINSGTSNLEGIRTVAAPIQVLLAGHMDTVFPLSHSFQTPKKLDENTLLGPGVADMKGGILVMLTAIHA